MKKRFAVVSLLICLAVMILPITAWAGWEKTSAGNTVYTVNGTKVKGWQTIGGKRYYFDPTSGVMLTGWRRIGKNARYYFGEDGVMRTGWQQIRGRTYYFRTDGKRVSGWVNIKDSRGKTYRYYFRPKGGRMLTGFRKIKGKHYYLGETGILQYGWIRVNGKVYYADIRTGELYINRWAGNYYFQSDGTLAQNRWVGYKWVGSDGQFTGVTNKVGFITENGKTFYYTNEHVKYKNGFITVDGKKYYLDSNGVLASGDKWIKVGNYKYYVNEDGEVLRSQWIGKSYVNAEGAMITGWADIDGNRYYFGSDGTYLKGWHTIGDSCYYFSKKGILRRNAWIRTRKKTYRTDAEGKRVYGICNVGGKYYYLGAKESSRPGVLIKGGIRWKGVRYYANKKTYVLYQDRFFRARVKKRYYTFYAKPNCQLAKGLTMARGSLYYFDSSCHMVKNRLVTVKGKSYYFGPRGKAQMGGVVTVNGVKYVIGTDGVILGESSKVAAVSSGKEFTGWKTENGSVHYYLNGTMVTGWQTIEGHKYYFSPEGAMQTGWQVIDGDTYYFTAAGVMVTGLTTIDNRKYYFFPTGKMAKNITIAVGAKMYTLQADGIVTDEQPITVEGDSLGTKIAREALNYVGNPYVYGGESLTEGCDCSGFTMLVFRIFGIKLGHYTNWQMNGVNSDRTPVYVDIDEDSLLPGDLIYYGSGNSSSHVAIYIGNGRIVHASNSQPYPEGGIKITNNWKFATVIKVVRYWA